MGWIGVDLDKTLAHYGDFHSDGTVGAPIPMMLQRVKKWLAAGKDVRIFTARASDPKLIPQIREWLRMQGLPDLPITNQKDFEMDEYWDDKAVQVIPNTGRRADGKVG